MNPLRDSQLQLLWTARIDYSTGSGVETHSHTDYDQLLVVLSGKGQIMIGQQQVEIKEGEAFLFLAGEAHSFRFTGNTITLDFKFRILDSQLRQWLTLAEQQHLCIDMELSELKQWYKLSLQLMRNPEAFHAMRIEAGFKGTLVSIFSFRSAAGNIEYKTFTLADSEDPIVHYLKIHFDEKITLERLSKHFGFNPHYLIKIFTDKTGITPIQFLQEVRLEKAKEYLELSSLPISEVAEKVGWTLPYFSKILKKSTGLTPTRYRESLLNAIGKDITLMQDFSNEWRIVSF